MPGLFHVLVRRFGRQGDGAAADRRGRPIAGPRGDEAVDALVAVPRRRQIEGGVRSRRLKDRQQAVFVFRRKSGAAVVPTAAGLLPRQQTQGHGADERIVLGIAEAVEEQDRQAQLIGRVQVRDGSPHEIGGLLNMRIVGGDAAFQQRQAGQGGQARWMLRPPGPVGKLLGFKVGDAAVDGGVDFALLVGRQPRRRRRLGRGVRGENHRRRTALLRIAVWRRLRLSRIGRGRDLFLRLLEVQSQRDASAGQHQQGQHDHARQHQPAAAVRRRFVVPRAGQGPRAARH